MMLLTDGEEAECLSQLSVRMRATIPNRCALSRAQLHSTHTPHQSDICFKYSSIGGLIGSETQFAIFHELIFNDEFDSCPRDVRNQLFTAGSPSSVVLRAHLLPARQASPSQAFCVN